MCYMKVVASLCMLLFLCAFPCPYQSVAGDFTEQLKKNDNTPAKQKRRKAEQQYRKDQSAKNAQRHQRMLNKAGMLQQRDTTKKPTRTNTLRKYSVNKREVCLIKLNNGGRMQGVVVKETPTALFLKDGDFTIELAKKDIKSTSTGMRNVYTRYQ